MTFLAPWFLLLLVVVAAAALWTLLRPSRQLAVVATLSLWRAALAQLDRSAASRRRRVSLSWLLLTAGAVAAALAVAGPVFQAGGAARRVALAVYPTGELATPDGMASLSAQAKALLDRLDSRDRVAVLEDGGWSSWLSPAEARQRVAGLPAMAVAAADVATTPAPAGSQRLYRVGPPGLGPVDDAAVSTIAVEPSLPPAVLDAVAAEPAAGRTTVFAAIRSTVAAPLVVELTAMCLKGSSWSATPATVALPAGARAAATIDCPGAAEAVAVLAAVPGSDQAWDAAYLAHAAASPRKVAMVGPDEPLIRRYIEVDKSLQLVSDAADADLVIANRSLPPAGKPALVIGPPSPPPSWQPAGELRNVLLRDADVDSDDPILRYVDTAGVAIRRARLWSPAGMDVQGKRLISTREGTLVLRQGGEGSGRPGRIYVAFDLAAMNTNLSMSESLVVLLSNATNWLAPPVASGFGFVKPLNAAWPAGATRVELALPTGVPSPPHQPARPLAPGLYRLADGTLAAASLVGLAAAQQPLPPVGAADVPLPPPQELGRPVELWPALLAVAMALWLGGWAARLRHSARPAVAAANRAPAAT
jgi:hypothetical protein